MGTPLSWPPLTLITSESLSPNTILWRVRVLTYKWGGVYKHSVRTSNILLIVISLNIYWCARQYPPYISMRKVARVSTLLQISQLMFIDPGQGWHEASWEGGSPLQDHATTPRVNTLHFTHEVPHSSLPPSNLGEGTCLGLLHNS